MTDLYISRPQHLPTPLALFTSVPLPFNLHQSSEILSSEPAVPEDLVVRLVAAAGGGGGGVWRGEVC